MEAAMLDVDRGYFSRYNPYEDSPQSIGHNATISAPHMHAYALEVLEPKLTKGAKVLDVGSGSGYLAACFSVMVTHLVSFTKLKLKKIKFLKGWRHWKSCWYRAY